MLVATRKRQTSHNASLTYLFNENVSLTDASGIIVLNGISLQESTELVDGIGGTTWEGSIVLSKMLENILSSNDTSDTPLHLIELGCGTGMCGIVTSKCYKSVISLTDRYCDLASMNIQKNLAVIQHSFPSNIVYPVETQPVSHYMSTQFNHEDNIIAVNMPWELGNSSLTQSDDNDNDIKTVSPYSLLQSRGLVDIIVGAEITCLIKQQALLVSTIVELCQSNPLAVVFMSFDGIPPASTETSSKYETQLNQLMATNKFQLLQYTAS